jgi:hypothetical protein
VVWIDNTPFTGRGTDKDIFYKSRSKDDLNWGTFTAVLSTESNESSLHPDIEIDPQNNVHVAWQDEATFEVEDPTTFGADIDIMYRELKATSFWENTQIVSTASNRHSERPNIAIDVEGTIHIVWQDYSNLDDSILDYDIFYKKLDENYDLWVQSPTKIMLDSGEDSERPVLITDNEANLHLFWYDRSWFWDYGADYDVFYMKNPIEGSYSDIELISIDSESTYLPQADSKYPAAVIDSASLLHVVWEDSTDYDGSRDSDPDIIYRRSLPDLVIRYTETTTEVDTTTEENTLRPTETQTITEMNTVTEETTIRPTETQTITDRKSDVPISFLSFLIALVMVPFIRLRKRP